MSRQFQYQAGVVTKEHEDNGKLKSTPTTQLVSRITFADGGTLVYKYDEEERITSVVETYKVKEQTITNTTLYTYDALGQLTKEIVNGADVNVMEYDNYGNILTKNDVVYAYKPKEEGWSDLLIKVGEGDDRTITYDDQGNPTSYLGHTLTWEKGRQLKSFDSNTYTYNANGIRTSKTVAGVKHDYILDGTKILREGWNYDEETKTYQDVLIPLYDNEDSVCGIIYNNVPYYFLKNLQGDVIAITNENGGVISRYTYDAWGANTGIITCAELTDGVDIANINPFRYRSYYFDKEIGMYYLQSRYYDPRIGRFVNADDVNMFQWDNSIVTNACTYANNSPVILADATGHSAVLVLVGGVTISLGAALTYLTGFLAAVCFLALLFSAKARRNIKAALTDVWNKAIDVVGYLKNAIAEVLAKAKRSVRYPGRDYHHIVAQTDYRAELSRQLLYDNGLKPSGAYNLIWVSRTLHKHLHTSAYHYGVYLVLVSMAGKAKNRNDRKYYILAGLVLIGVLLSAASNAI